jgi:hypothetical protein
MESTGMVREYPSDSIWIPHGHSIWNDGIYVESMSFHVDSMGHGITKMS